MWISTGLLMFCVGEDAAETWTNGRAAVQLGAGDGVLERLVLAAHCRAATTQAVVFRNDVARQRDAGVSRQVADARRR